MATLNTRVVRSINKVQNSIILLIFKMRKNRNTGFVRNLALSNNCEFYYNDITVASIVNDKIALKASQLSVIRFLWSKRLYPNAVHSEMRPINGDKTSNTCLM